MDGVAMKDAPPITSLPSLPDDPAALKPMIATLTRRCDESEAARVALIRRVDTLEASEQRLTARAQDLELAKLRLEMELLRYKKWVYGPRADRLATLGEVNQMLLGFGEDLDARPVNAADLPANEPAPGGAPRRVRRAEGRRNLENFEHLPVTRCEHDLPEHEKPCPCCGKMREKIGEESSWQIEYIPGHFERLEHVRFKYACPHCERSAAPGGPQITRADQPGRTIEKGMAGPGLLAFVVTSKFSDYLPLYRLEDIFERGGFTIARATQSLWCRDVAEMVRPLYDLMVRRVLESRVVCTDDTVMPMLAPGKATRARMWVYVGDDDHPYHVFQFTLSRSRDGPAQFLKRYKGTLLADAYGGYDGIVVGNEIVRAGCWAHARRKFVDAEPTHPAMAAEAVGMIRRLYAIEDRVQGLDAEARRSLRQSESAPVLAALRDRLYAWRDQMLPKHPMAQAVAYTLNQWNELTVFAGDGPDAGRVPIDNNASEREMKRVVLNRKNSLFVGNERGGRTAAILSSFTSTCRRHAIDPQRYLTQLLTNLPDTPVSQLGDWLPDQWKRRDTPPPT
jgi:transposase